MAEENSFNAAGLKRLMDERDRLYMKMFEASDASVRMAFESAEKALTKAEFAAQKRFESLNEFREAMQDMQQTFARSDVVNARIVALDEKCNELFRRFEIIKGRGSALHDVWGWIVGAVAAGAALAHWLLNR